MRLPAHASRPTEPGFTLIELLVVLIVMGISLVLVVPAIIPPARTPANDLQSIVDATRRAAVRRAESLTLTIGSDGRWLVQHAGDAARLEEGAMPESPGVSLHVRITPLGACFPADEAAVATALDPASCRILGAEPTR